MPGGRWILSYGSWVCAAASACLDLACGFGRHSLELARRDFAVTGVDITPSYIRFAEEVAQKEGLNARFFCQDIREANFEQTFDAVLNMADGAIGYLENDAEN